MCALALLFSIIFLASLRVAISGLRLSVRTIYNIGMGLMVISMLMLISAMILELVLT